MVFHVVGQLETACGCKPGLPTFKSMPPRVCAPTGQLRSTGNKVSRSSRAVCSVPPVTSRAFVTALKRRHCCVRASQQQQAELPSEHTGEEEYDEHEGSEFDEGEWDAYEEWEEGEEAEEGDAESAAAPVSTVKQIPAVATSVPFSLDDFVEVGLISRAHGVKGEVKVQCITDQPKQRLGTAGKRLWLSAPSGRATLTNTSSSSSSTSTSNTGGASITGGASNILHRVTVQSGRVARPESKDRRAEWAVKFSEVADREKAAALAGHKVLLALCDREAAPRLRDEFFITDLVGLKVLDSQTQHLVGIVTEVYDTSASYSLLRVRLAPTEEDIAQSKYRSVLVPFVTEFVPDVDVAGGVLQLSSPEGLLDTASSRKLRRPYSAEQQEQLRQQLTQRTQQQQQRIQQQQQQQQGLSSVNDSKVHVQG